MNEPLVEVAESKEGLNSTDRTRVFPVRDHPYLVRIDLNTVRRNDEPKVFCPLDAELALLDVCLQACSLQLLDHLLDVYFILELVLRVD